MDIAENMRVIIVSKVLEDVGNKQSGFQRLNEGSRQKSVCFMITEKQSLASHIKDYTV